MYVQYGCENQSKVVYSLGSTSTGSPSGNRSVTSSVTSTHKMRTLAAPQVRKWLFFNPNFQDIILAPIRVGWNTQRWSWGHLKKHIFSTEPLTISSLKSSSAWIIFCWWAVSRPWRPPSAMESLVVSVGVAVLPRYATGVPVEGEIASSAKSVNQFNVNTSDVVFSWVLGRALNVVPWRPPCNLQGVQLLSQPGFCASLPCPPWRLEHRGASLQLGGGGLSWSRSPGRGGGQGTPSSKESRGWDWDNGDVIVTGNSVSGNVDHVKIVVSSQMWCSKGGPKANQWGEQAAMVLPSQCKHVGASQSNSREGKKLVLLTCHNPIVLMVSIGRLDKRLWLPYLSTYYDNNHWAREVLYRHFGMFHEHAWGVGCAERCLLL